MKVLAVETATLTGSVGLLSDDDGLDVLGETTLSVSVQHSERLMPAIDQLLRDAGVASGEIDLYAVSAGPGSFTGLRIGLAAAQGLALAHGRPVVGVSTLEGLARNGFYFPGLVVPMLNAFRSEIYWGAYRANGTGFDCVGKDCVSSPDHLIDYLRERSEPILILGNGVEVCGVRIAQELGEECLRIAPKYLHPPRAVHVAFLAAQSFKDGLAEEPVLPRYLRKPG